MSSCQRSSSAWHLHRILLVGTVIVVAGGVFNAGCGGGGFSPQPGTPNAAEEPTPAPDVSDEDNLPAVGSVGNPAKHVAIELPLLSHFNGNVTAFDVDAEFLYVAHQYIIDVYRLSDGVLVRTVTFPGTIADLLVHSGDIYLMLDVPNAMAGNDAHRLYRFSPASLGTLTDAPFFDLPASNYSALYKLHDAGDRLYIDIAYEQRFLTVEITADGELQQLADVVPPFGVSKMRVSADRAVLLGSKPKPEGGIRTALSIVNRSDLQGEVELYPAKVTDFDIVADHFLAVGVGADVKYHDLSAPGYPLVRTDPAVHPLQIEANGTLLAITGTDAGSELFLVAFQDSDTVEGNSFDLTGDGGVFAAGFSWSHSGLERHARWRGDSLVLLGWGDSLALLSTAGADPLVPTVRKIVPKRYHVSPLQFDGDEIIYSSGHHLETWSIADPIAPQRVNQGFIGNATNQIVRQNGWYFVMRLRELESWQLVGNALVQRDSLSLLEDTATQQLGDVRVFGDLAVVATYEQCMLVNVADPLNLQHIATIETGCNAGATAHGDYLLIKGDGAQLAVYDIHDPAHPSLIQQHEDLFYGALLQESVTDDHIFSGTSYQSFLIEDPMHIQLDRDVLFYFESPAGTATLQSRNGAVVDSTRQIVAYYNWGFTSPSTIVFFRLAEGTLQYLGTATAPLGIDALYTHGDLLIACEQNDGIFLFAWPEFPDVQGQTDF